MIIPMDFDFGKAAEKYDKTCSLFNLKDNCITFAREKKYLDLLRNTHFNLAVVVPKHMLPVTKISDSVEIFSIDNSINIDYYFTLLHNFINKDKEPVANKIGRNCVIHSSVIMDVPGNTYAIGPLGERVMMKHMGGVIIGDNVDIAAYSVIHTSTMDSTIIKDGVKICVMCNVGHNVFIGENTFLAPGVRLAGGTNIGKNCFIWQGALIGGSSIICDNVSIGMGSVLLEDITEPGVYYGNPCVYRKPYEGLKKTLRKI